VSKSTLRIALDRVTSRGLENLYYWPSFEIVRWVGANLPYSAYGAGGDSRHVSDHLVREIIDAFVEAFWVPEAAAQLRPFVMEPLGDWAEARLRAERKALSLRRKST